jgi:hypothetical protein
MADIIYNLVNNGLFPIAVFSFFPIVLIIFTVFLHLSFHYCPLEKNYAHFGSQICVQVPRINLSSTFYSNVYITEILMISNNNHKRLKVNFV